MITRSTSEEDLELAVDFLSDTPTHAGRDRAQLLRWAQAADRFGAALPAQPSRADVVERDGGLERRLLARYLTRPTPTIELFTDTLALAERLIDDNGWRHWYPDGSVRAAALLHESVHHQLHHADTRAQLRHALDHTALRIGRLRIRGHVAGAEEIAAHAHARTVCGLGRSPLHLTAALAEQLDERKK
ncbi:hypothetical protein [Streptomyces sp. NPDC056405]|uniref:hypothetical protein n=1 Tax=Streptomyces sp. NPDC056405 TaxID=3345811 RepID=UPI0035DF4FF2